MYPADSEIEIPVNSSRQRSLFSILDDSTRQAFIEQCNVVLFDAGQSIFLQGAMHEYSYIIKSGAVRTYYVADTGREITLGHWSEGDLVGGPLVFGGGYHVWSGAATKRSEVLAISGPDLRDFASSHDQVYPWIVDVLSFKLGWLSILFQIHGTEHVQERLIKLLIMLGGVFGTEGRHGIVIEHRIDQQDLAALVGASRQWTNKTLTNLRKADLIAIRNRRIILLDVPRLKAMIGDD